MRSSLTSIAINCSLAESVTAVRVFDARSHSLELRLQRFRAAPLLRRSRLLPLEFGFDAFELRLDPIGVSFASSVSAWARCVACFHPATASVVSSYRRFQLDASARTSSSFCSSCAIFASATLARHRSTARPVRPARGRTAARSLVMRRCSWGDCPIDRPIEARVGGRVDFRVREDATRISIIDGVPRRTLTSD